MKLVDANVLLYAVNVDTTHHARSRRWLDGALSGGADVGFTWIALLAFIRLSTKAGLFPHPLAIDEAFDRVDRWLDAPSAVLLQPGPAHPRLLRSMLEHTGSGGNLTNDAHLAALAAEHKATVVSFDDDFSRFPGVRWERPSPSEG